MNVLWQTHAALYAQFPDPGGLEAEPRSVAVP